MTDPLAPDHPTVHRNWATLTEDEAQPWQTLESRQLVDGYRVVLEDRVRVTEGVETLYQYRPRGPRAVFVLPVTAAGEAVLIRQYRYPLRATIMEVVAGGVERGEGLLPAAARELLEEVGGVSDDWIPLPGFYPQPSISGVIFYATLALNVTLGQTQHEDTETIERVVVPLAEAYRMVEAGEIQDGPSGLTLFHARRHLVERGLL
ncbi:NUDIX hydrolase [Deinococcus arenicola]|uniref:NUDIX hydrolase n=1 Tax=Deinococcus arenicola TaxID=2994950 RepID=A0ABU4DSH1_9DEIO|nr:NUDIX hydrolase [Deinococcus sp. ZS9-10]MDV6375370.1 NUDIX hydrolase [Deinococcus sp. ZS9-10]